MSDKYRFLYGLTIILLFILNITLAFKIKSLNENNSLVSEKISDFDHYYDMFRHWNAETIKNNDTKLSPELKLEDEEGNQMLLRQITEINRGVPKLVIKTSALACNICLEEEFKHIGKYISTIGSDNVVVLASDYNLRSLKTLKQSAPFDFKLYQLQKLGIPFEEIYKNLFVFILDEDLRIKSFFVPEKTLPELSENYYTAVCETYFKQ